MDVHSSKQVASDKLFHYLNNPKNKGSELLVIANFDYFLHKGDLGLLFDRYRAIILIPCGEVDEQYILQKICSIAPNFEKLHLVINPQYQGEVLTLLKGIESIQIDCEVTKVYDFCEKILRKVYIPKSFTGVNPNISENLNFKKRVRYPKKILDISVSIVLFIISFPLWVFSYFRIRSQSPGPVFYKQERIGLNNNTFFCLKFRSMYLDAEKNGAMFSQRRDNRIFPYGIFMRATRIDELPQIINIFQKDISLIGPRPERPIFTKVFENSIPYYNLRHNVEPGITGYAQVMFTYGAGEGDARHKLMYDLYYIKNWTIKLELYIVFKTIWVILMKSGR